MLKDGIRYFVEEKKIMACLTVSWGDAATSAHVGAGTIDLAETRAVGEDSIFDLASLTKLFTGVTTMRLWEEGALSLTRPVTDYAPMFPGLRQTTVDQVLGFEQTLLTPERIDTQANREAGLNQLFRVHAVPHGTGRYYSDMHAMVLKYVIEGASGERYFDCVHKRILGPLGMTSTFARVPADRRDACVSCDREHRIEGTRWLLRDGVAPGMPHDPKARLLSPDGSDVCGHAGLFSTRGDMVRLCQGLLAGKIISRDSLRAMARNRTGHPLPGGGYTQYLGSQCYVKHPDQYFSEIPAYMSDEAIGLSGFTGHHLSVDPVTGVFALFLGDRVLNRLSVLVPETGRTIMDYGLAADGSGQVAWPDGTRVYSSVDYVHQKDRRLHAPIAQLMGLPVWQKSDCARPSNR